MPRFGSNESVYKNEIGRLYGMVMVLKLITAIFVMEPSAITLCWDESNALYKVLNWKHRIASSSQQ